MEAAAGRSLLALGLLSTAFGLTVSSAGASGEVATAVLTSPLTGSSATFTWAYDLQSNGGNELDDLAMSLCPDVLSHFVSATPSGRRS